jgi:Tol biopolymer transport system component
VRLWGVVGAVLAAGVVGGGALVAYRAYAGRSPASTRDGSPAWSPDAQRIAFYSERDGNAEIYVMNADGSNERRLTNTTADEGYPSWSPDGTTITFDTDRDGNFEIYAMGADGTNPRRLTNDPATDVSASWSPDGTRIAFMSNRDGMRPGEFDVYIMPVTGSGRDAVRVTTTGTSWFPVYSRDGSTLAFHVGRDVYVMPAAGGALTRLTTDPANGMYPSWSPDGSTIAFMSWRGGRTEIFVMNADGSGQRRVVSMPAGDAIDPRFSPDGTQIVFVHVPGGMQNGAERSIWVVKVDGTGLTRLTGG